ncbi:SufD family Fe-S cluster assembly protein, partial [bacterium]|nr:SufD family Fe-S cluster assembly protein [bacterium]
MSGSLSGAAATAARQSFTTYANLRTPEPTEEVWRYVEIPFDLDDVSLLDAPGARLPADDRIRRVLGSLAGSALIVDGFIETIEEGTGPALVSSIDSGQPAGATIPAGLDRYSAAASAFGRGAIVLNVPRGTAIGDPYFVEVQATAAGTVSFPKVVVDGGDGSEAKVVIHYRSLDGVDVSVVPQVEVNAGANARVNVTTIREWGDETAMIGHHRLVAGRDAAVSAADFGMGGR